MDLSRVMMFSKHLQGLPLDRAAPLARAAGVTHLDLTVRPGGHVEPARAGDDLPRVVEQLAGFGLGVGMITTAITDANDPAAEPVLRAAAAAGIKYYKLGYYRYGGFGTLRQQRRDVAAKLKALADLNLSLGVHGGYHNHCDDFFGANLADLDAVLEGLDKTAVGVYLDPTHATIEGGCQGWLMGLDLVAPRVTMLAVKDFVWSEKPERYAGARRHKVEFHPLDGGNVPWPAVLKVLKQVGFDGPVSFHSEYQGPHSFADLDVPGVIEQTRKDVELFRAWAA
jgi:sugar phosphate isomerase/epimerase